MAVSKRLRFEILRRDKHTCRYCGGKAPKVSLHVDHVVPTTLGGSDDPKNLVAACIDCNSGKSATPADAPTVQNVADDALRWSRAMQQAAKDIEVGELSYKAELAPYFDSINSNWTAWLPDDWKSSISTFMRCGLPWQAMDEFVSIALNARTNDPWRYFCGCCWRHIRKVRERATEIVEDDSATASEPAEVQEPQVTYTTRWTADEIQNHLECVADFVGQALDEFVCDRHDEHCEDIVCRLNDLAYRWGRARGIALNPPYHGLKTEWSEAKVQRLHEAAVDLLRKYDPEHGERLLTCEHAAWETLCGDPLCTVEMSATAIGMMPPVGYYDPDLGG